MVFLQFRAKSVCVFFDETVIVGKSQVARSLSENEQIDYYGSSFINKASPAVVRQITGFLAHAVTKHLSFYLIRFRSILLSSSPGVHVIGDLCAKALLFGSVEE